MPPACSSIRLFRALVFWFVMWKAAALAMLMIMAGCNGAAAISRAEFPDLVLRPDDVAGSLRLFDHGPVTGNDIAPGPRSDAQRFGRTGGWKARYRRVGRDATSGVLVLESRAEVFEETSGAERELGAYKEELAADEGSATLQVTDLGDEALGAMTSTAVTKGVVRYFTIVWRSVNVTASIVVSGFEHEVAFEDAVRLARRQQRHIDSVLE